MNKLEDISKLITAVKDGEPRLTDDEKSEMWGRIVAQSADKPKRLWRRWIAAAAIVAAILAGSMVYWFEGRSSAPDLMAELATVESAVGGRVMLQAGDMKVEAGNQAAITFLPDGRGMSVRQGSSQTIIGTSGDGLLKVSVPQRCQISVKLADGSIITLHGGAKFVAPLSQTGKYRKVALIGEAYMSIHHDEERPFTAMTRGMDVNVLGTEFDLTAYENGRSSVTLVNGLIEAKAANGKVMRVKPGQTLTYDPGLQALSMKNETDTESLTAWKDNLLVMRDLPLAQTLSKLEDVYGVKFTYKTSDINAIRLSGKLDLTTPIDGQIETLKRIAPIMVTKKGRQYIVKLK